jgi:hypothetical protein
VVGIPAVARRPRDTGRLPEPPPVARTGSQFKTSNLRLVVLGLVVLVLVVAMLVGSRG